MSSALHLRYVQFNVLSDVICRIKDNLSILFVSLIPKLHHHCPSSGDHVSRATASNCRSCVKPTVPLRASEELVRTPGWISKQKCRHTLRSKSILVWVTGNRCNSGCSEVKVARRIVTAFLNTWIDEATQTTVTVTTDAPFLGKSRNLRCRIEIAVGVLRATANKHYRV